MQQGQLWLALKHGQVLVSDMQCVHNIGFSNQTPVAGRLIDMAAGPVGLHAGAGLGLGPVGPWP